MYLLIILFSTTLHCENITNKINFESVTKIQECPGRILSNITSNLDRNEYFICQHNTTNDSIPYVLDRGVADNPTTECHGENIVQYLGGVVILPFIIATSIILHKYRRQTDQFNDQDLSVGKIP